MRTQKCENAVKKANKKMGFNKRRRKNNKKGTKKRQKRWS